MRIKISQPKLSILKVYSSFRFTRIGLKLSLTWKYCDSIAEGLQHNTLSYLHKKIPYTIKCKGF